MSSPERPWDQSAEGEEKPKSRAGLIGAIVTVLVIGGCAAMFNGEEEPDDGGGEYGARDVCEQFVEKRLKSPGSAEFSDESATGDSGTYTVAGSVDSENGFGALVRNQYVCKVTHASGDNWRLMDLEMTSN